jgi:5-methylcytosine-specific restriction endonuclease McrA
MRLKYNITKEQLYQLYIIENKTAKECVKFFECSNGLIRLKIKEYEIYKPKYLQNNCKKFNIMKEKLYQLYIIENKTRKECAEFFGCSDPLIKQKIRKYGLQKPKHLQSKNVERKETLYCENCGSSFIVSRFRATNEKWKLRFCSHSCSSEFRYLGEDHKRAVLNSISARRRCRIRDAFDETADQQKINEIYCKAKQLTEETGISYEVDHIIPISKGGKHHEDNLQIITMSENRKKHNKIIEN